MSNLKKRFLTSSILLLLLFFMEQNIYILTYALLVFGLFSIIEFHKLLRIIIIQNFYSFILNFLFILYISIFCFLFFYFSQFPQLKFITFSFLITCIFSDLGGYICGNFFKGPKLTKISPNKTISGAVGSLLFSAIILILIFFVFLGTFNYINIILGITISISCQAGDLFFSFLKRKAKVKDSGNFFPGHGGVLDRLDGVFLGIPIGFIFMIYFN